MAYIDTFRGLFDLEPICAVLTEHGVTIASSMYHACQACPMSAASLEAAYLADARYTLWQVNWGVYEVRSCTTPPLRPASMSAGTRSVG